MNMLLETFFFIGVTFDICFTPETVRVLECYNILLNYHDIIIELLC